ncbi:MAG: hypothetical protein H7X71_02645 [Chitinophagales bacterium]|nr:hypothetical protein [Chitinophagales bacterium]
MAGADEKDATSSHKAVDTYVKNISGTKNEILNSKSEILYPKHETRNTKPEILSSKPEVLNSKSEPETLNFVQRTPFGEPGTLNSKYKFAYYPQAIDHEKIDPEIRNAIYNTVDELRNEGHTVEARDIKYLDALVPAYYVLTTAEASSNLSRFAGIHYGYRDMEAGDLESVVRNSRSKGFGKEVKRRIMLGTFVLSSGYYDAYYTHAQKVRRIIRTETEKILEEFDFIILPTTPTTAFNIGEIKDPIEMYLADIFTVQANLTGMPAISVPLYVHTNGLPFGLQIIGKHYEESAILGVTSRLLKLS